MSGFGFSLDIKTGGMRHWYVDKVGVKRWVFGDDIVDEEIKNKEQFVTTPSQPTKTE